MYKGTPLDRRESKDMLASSGNDEPKEATTCLGRLHMPRCKMKIHGRLWKIKSKGAILTLVLNYFVASTMFTLAWLLLKTNFASTAQEYFKIIMDQPFLPCLAVLVVSCPVAGYIADAHFNRYKILRFGLWLSWIGMIIITLFLLINHIHRNQSIICGTGAVVGSLLVMAGLSAYTVNAIHFGIDQMPDASAEELSAYIHWVTFGTCAANLTAQLTYPIQYCFSADYQSGYFLIQLMVPMTLLSLALSCDFLFCRWLIIEPGCPNSLRMIYRVLKFAATHKYPIRRRAITYTEDEKPSRIDFAKDKYGGPFTTEQVEDVKTFFRILVVLASVPALFLPMGLTITSFIFIIDKGVDDVCDSLSQQISYSIPLFGIVIIPLYTFLLYPLIRNRILSMLQRAVLAATLTVILGGALLIIDSVMHAVDPDIACMFTTSTQVLSLYKIWWSLPFYFVTAVVLVLGGIAIVEFTCAQSPYSMRGLLFGVLFSVSMFTLPLTFGIFAAWNSFQKQISPSCDFYYFLFQFLCAVAGLIVLCIVARWYKRRRREEEDDQRRIVEAIYDRMLRNQT